MSALEPGGAVPQQSLAAMRLFPLPDTVLFPGTMLPLHVFEPRYRTMVADALAGDRLIAIAMLKPGYEESGDAAPPLHDTVGVGQIIHVQRVKDGRYYLALQGLCRARIDVERPSGLVYRVAQTSVLEDILPEGGEAALEHEVAAVHACLMKLVARVPQRAQAVTEVMEALTTPGMLADVLCALALENADERQALLATVHVDQRLRAATHALADLLLRTTPEDGSTEMVQ